MLSDFLFVGVVVGATMLGVGLLAQALPANSDGIEDQRRALMVLLAAFIEALGVLACIAGFMALFVVVPTAGGVAAAVLVIVPLVAFGIPAVRLTRPSGRDGVRAGMTLMLAFIGGLAAVASMVGLTALLVSDVDASGFDVIVVVATVVVAAAAIGIGIVGSRALRELGSAVAGGSAVDIPPIRSRALITAAVFQGVAIIALVVVVWLTLFARE